MSSFRLESAARQVRLLHGVEASPPLAHLADRLRSMQAAVDAHLEHGRTVRRQYSAVSIEVLETIFTEFERHDTVAPEALDSKTNWS